MVASGNFPANICWSWRRLPLRHVLKTSSRHVFNTSSTSLQRNNFTSSETSWRRLERILLEPWRRLQDAFKTSWETKILLRWRLAEVVLKRCLEDVLKRCFEDVLKICLEPAMKTLWRQTKYLWGYMYLAKLNVYLINLYFTNLYLTILRRIQMH